MSNPEGPFPQTTFMGASVMAFNSTVGWDEQSSTVTVNLVEDPIKHDRFTRPICGTPASFQFGDFKFGGLVQRWVQKNDFEGNPTFEVMLTDPREILSGVQIILSSYRGDVGGFANLINVFGYWEALLGFGGALANESGMVWSAPFDILGISPSDPSGGITITPAGTVGIMPAIHAITTGHGGVFGGPIQFMGYAYDVDLSALPVPPAYYRMGGVAASLMDMISELCQDGGSDYLCYLDGSTIRFKCVSRRNQPSPGQIANFINGRQDVTSKNIGYELRNDVNNAIILGGDITSVSQIINPDGGKTVWPFWGFDLSNGVIMGEGDPSQDEHTFTLNASEVADILGDVKYDSNITEMRFARSDYDSWAFYVMKTKPDIAEAINLVGALDATSELQEFFQDTIFSRDLVDASQNTVTQYGIMNESDYWTTRAQKMYEFVRRASEEYFGRKFLVAIPFAIFWKFEPETTHRISSDEPTDAGYTPEGSMPLGLQFLNEGKFLSQDGRYTCFVRFGDAADKLNLQQVPPDSFVVQGNDVYLKASVDNEIGIVYPPNTFLPYCVVNLDSPLYAIPPDALGGVEDIAKVMNSDDDTLFQRLKDGAAGLRYDSFPIRISPVPYRPDAIALPMKSNRDSYGPWFTSGGVVGKVTFERDEELVPWNYGGFDLLNQAAQAKLANAATSQQYTETGTVEIAGFPDHSLGDSLVAGGPQLTGIDVSRSTGGFTTIYRMQTYTPRLVGFSKGNADRLRRLGMAAQDMRRLVRNLYQRQLYVSQVYSSASSGQMANASRAVRQQTPHQCIIGTMTDDEQYGYRTQVATMTAQEAVANTRGDNKDLWVATGCMTMEGLLRPFSTNRQREPDDPLGDMPHYQTVDVSSIPVTRAELDPFGDKCDVDYLAWGDEHPGGMHTLKKEPDLGNARALGLRGPLILVGWGYTYTGKPVPNSTGTDDQDEKDWSDSFLQDHRTHPEKWRAGPVDLRWDNWRKVWTIPTVLFGTVDTDGGTTMTVDFSDDKVDFENWLGGTFKADQKIVLAYNQHNNKWRVIAAECVTTS